MKRLFFATDGASQVRPDQLAQVIELHHGYGVVLGLDIMTEAVVHLDGSATGLTTEVLRLAAIGAEAEAMLRAGIDGKISDLVNDRDVDWKAAIK